MGVSVSGYVIICYIAHKEHLPETVGQCWADGTRNLFLGVPGIQRIMCI